MFIEMEEQNRTEVSRTWNVHEEEIYGEQNRTEDKISSFGANAFIISTEQNKSANSKPAGKLPTPDLN